MRELGDRLRKLLALQGVTPVMRLLVQVPQETVLRVTDVAATGPTVSIVDREGMIQTADAAAGASDVLVRTPADRAKAIAKAIQDAEVEGLWANSDADRSDVGFVRIVVAPELNQLPQILAGGTEVVDTPATPGAVRFVELNSSDVPMSAIGGAVGEVDQPSGFGTIVEAESLKTAIDVRSREPIGAAFLIRVAGGEGIRRLFLVHPPQSLRLNLFLGAYHARDEVRVAAANQFIGPAVPEFESFGQWYVSEEPVGHPDGTVTLTIIDEISRLANLKLQPLQFRYLHPYQAIEEHLETIGLRSGAGYAPGTFNPTRNPTKGHFIVGNYNLDQNYIVESPRDAQERSISFTKTLQDLLVTTGDALRINDEGNLELILYDPTTEPVRHFRAGPDTGFDATVPELVSPHMYNRIVWDVPISLLTPANRDGVDQKYPERISQKFESEASRIWLRKIEDLSIENPYIGRATSGGRPVTGSVWNTFVPLNYGQDSMVFEPYTDSAGGLIAGSDRVRVKHPHVSNWCGLRVVMPDYNLEEPANDERYDRLYDPDFKNPFTGSYPAFEYDELVYEDDVANLNPEEGRIAFIRFDPPGGRKRVLDLPVAEMSGLFQFEGREIIPDEPEFLPEVIAIDEWIVLLGDEPGNVHQIRTHARAVLLNRFDASLAERENLPEFIRVDPYIREAVLEDLQFHIAGDFMQLDPEEFPQYRRIISTRGDGRGINNTLVPHAWALRPAPNPRAPKDVATMSDITIATYRSAELLNRFEFGAPEIRFDVRISNLDLQLADVITIDDPSYVGYRRSGLDRTVTFEITGLEYHWLADQPRITITAVQLADNGNTSPYALKPTRLVPENMVPRNRGVEYLRRSEDFSPDAEIGFSASTLTAEWKRTNSAQSSLEAEFRVMRWRPVKNYTHVLGRFVATGIVYNAVTQNYRTFRVETDYTFDYQGVLSLRSTGQASKLRESGALPEDMEIRLDAVNNALEVWAIGTEGEQKEAQVNAELHAIEQSALIEPPDQVSSIFECDTFAECEFIGLEFIEGEFECDAFSECEFIGAVDDVVQDVVSTFDCEARTECEFEGVVQAPPECRVAADGFQDGDVIVRGDTQTLSFEARDDVGVVRAELYINRNLVQTWPPATPPALPSDPDTWVRFDYQWDTSNYTGDGAVVTFVAFDAGDRECAETIKADFEDAPADFVCTVTGLTDGDVVSGTERLVISVTNTPGLAEARLTIDNILVRKWPPPPDQVIQGVAQPDLPTTRSQSERTFTFTYDWNTTASPNESVVIRFMATDLDGRSCDLIAKAVIENPTAAPGRVTCALQAQTAAGGGQPAISDGSTVTGNVWFRITASAPTGGPLLRQAALTIDGDDFWFDSFPGPQNALSIVVGPWDSAPKAGSSVIVRLEVVDVNGGVCVNFLKLEVGGTAPPPVEDVPFNCGLFLFANNMEVSDGDEVTGEIEIRYNAEYAAGIAGFELSINGSVQDSGTFGPTPPMTRLPATPAAPANLGFETFTWNTSAQGGSDGVLIRLDVVGLDGRTCTEFFKVDVGGVAPPPMDVAPPECRLDARIDASNPINDGDTVSGTIQLLVRGRDPAGIAGYTITADGRTIGGRDFPPEAMTTQFGFDSEGNPDPTVFNFDTTILENGQDLIFKLEVVGVSGLTCLSFLKLTVNNPVIPDADVPVCRINSPQDGETISGTETLVATASDPATITRISWQIDSQPPMVTNLDMPEASPDPFELELDTTSLSNEGHIIRFEATNANGVMCRDTIKVEVQNDLPTCQLTLPVAGQSFVGPYDIVFRVQAPRGVQTTQLFVDGVPIDSRTFDDMPTDTGFLTFGASVADLSVGNHTLRLLAVDANNETCEESVQFVRSDAIPPTVDFSFPGVNVTEFTTAAAVSFRARIRTSGGRFARRILMLKNGVQVGQVGESSASTSLLETPVFTFQPGNEPNGPVVFTAVGTDSDGVTNRFERRFTINIGANRLLRITPSTPPANRLVTYTSSISLLASIQPTGYSLNPDLVSRRIYIDDDLLMENRSTSQINQIRFNSWNPTAAGLTNGQHMVRFEAETSDGRIWSSEVPFVFNGATPGPTIAFTRPEANEVVSGSVTVDFDRTLPPGAMFNRLEFFVDDETDPSLEFTEEPTSFQWDTSSSVDGEHTLRLRITDSNNRSGEATLEVIVRNADTTPPRVTWNTPAADAALGFPLANGNPNPQQSTPLSVSVIDDQSEVRLVEFLVDGTLIDSETANTRAPNYSGTWEFRNWPDGPHLLTVRATDEHGNRGEATRRVFVRSGGEGGAIPTAPTVDIQQPTTGSTVSGDIPVRATVLGDNVQTTQLFVDGTIFRTNQGRDGAFSLPTDEFTNGNHTLTVRAVDAQGNVGTDSVVITIANEAAPAISVRIDSPMDGFTVTGDSEDIAFTVTGGTAPFSAQLIVDGANVGSPVNITGASGMLTWPTAGASNRGYTVSVQITDNASMMAFDTIKLTVSRPDGGPRITFVGPTNIPSNNINVVAQIRVDGTRTVTQAFLQAGADAAITPDTTLPAAPGSIIRFTWPIPSFTGESRQYPYTFTARDSEGNPSNVIRGIWTIDRS